MKIFFLVFILFFSNLAFATVEIHIGGVEVECVYNEQTGATVCERVDATGDTPGVWNPKTFSCTNYVAPVANAAGDITCPSINSVKISKSNVVPHPSKDDVACDPSKGTDSGCASQTTAAKANDLISESNSMLGSIASSNATNANLLNGILNTLQGIASQGSPVDAAGNSSSGSGDSSSDSSLSSDVTDIPGISSPSSASFSCPSPEFLSILGRNYEFSYDLLCNFADSMRGLVIAIGAFSALLIVITAL